MENGDQSKGEYGRVEVAGISMQDFFDDAFRPIARDGAGNIEVMLMLQKALKSLYTIYKHKIQEAALYY